MRVSIIYFLGAALATMGLVLAVPKSCHAQGYLVFGDSQSFVVQDTGDARHNWPSILQQATGKHFFNLSRGGRKLSDGHIGPYLRLVDVHPENQQIRGIIIALGSLDALFHVEPITALTGAIEEAYSRGLEVICILPPDNQFMTNEQVRSDIAAVCPQSLDISVAVGPADMIDPVHFGQQGHAKYATAVLWWLALQGAL